MILLVGGIKGGTGKSTIARNLAVFAAQEGRRVCLVDADPQKTITNWVGRRPTEQIGYEFKVMELTSPILTSGRPDPKGIAPRLSSFSRDYDLLIVDCGGKDSGELRSAMLVADGLLTSFSPSPDDVETVSQLLELINKAEISRGRELPALAVTSRASPNPMTRGVGMMRETFGDLADLIPLSPTVVHEREANKRLSLLGLCVADSKESDYKAYWEMRAVYDEIFEGAEDAPAVAPSVDVKAITKLLMKR